MEGRKEKRSKKKKKLGGQKSSRGGGHFATQQTGLEIESSGSNPRSGIH